jgi:hypothetical protein
MKMEAMENKVRLKHDYTSNARIDEEIEPWILNTGYLRSRDTK